MRLQKTIKKELPISRVVYCTIEMNDGLPMVNTEMKTIDLNGHLDNSKVMGVLLERGVQPVITNIEHMYVTYSMDMKDFIEHARITKEQFKGD